MRAARRRARDPLPFSRRVHGILHEAVRARLDAQPAIIGRTIEAHGGAERAARNFERADEASQESASPAALIAAPAIVYGLAEGDRDRPQWQDRAFDLYVLAYAGMVEEFVRDSPDCVCGDIANRGRPLRGMTSYMIDEMR